MIEERRFVLETMPRNAACGIVCVGAAAAAIGLAGDPQRTWPQLLLNSFYIVSVALGGMVFIALHYLSGAAWSAGCLLYTSPSPRDRQKSRMPSSA